LLLTETKSTSMDVSTCRNNDDFHLQVFASKELETEFFFHCFRRLYNSVFHFLSWNPVTPVTTIIWKYTMDWSWWVQADMQVQLCSNFNTSLASNLEDCDSFPVFQNKQTNFSHNSCM